MLELGPPYGWSRVCKPPRVSGCARTRHGNSRLRVFSAVVTPPDGARVSREQGLCSSGGARNYPGAHRRSLHCRGLVKYMLNGGLTSRRKEDNVCDVSLCSGRNYCAVQCGISIPSLMRLLLRTRALLCRRVWCGPVTAQHLTGDRHQRFPVPLPQSLQSVEAMFHRAAMFWVVLDPDTARKSY